MSERLFIRLGTDAQQPCSYLVWSAQDQQIIASGEVANAMALSSLTDKATNRLVDVLVPTSALTITSISLPEKGQKQALKALPFMLEETLADNVEQMHFVVGPRDGEQICVAAVTHEQMQQWLTWLSDAGLKAAAIVPDTLALPLADCQWAAMAWGDEYLLRTGITSAVSLPSVWMDMMLPKLLPLEREQFAVAGYTPMTIEAVNVVTQTPELPMQTLALGMKSAAINLLSGPYKPKKEYSKHLLLWRNSAIMLALIFVLALVHRGVSIYQLDQQTAQLKAQTEQVYKRVVPGSNRIVNVRSQIKEKLRSLQGQGGGGEFFSMLTSMETAFKKVPDLTPTSIRFDAKRGEIRMQISAKDYGQIEQFSQQLSAHFSVKSGAMNSAENAVTSTLTIRTK